MIKLSDNDLQMQFLKQTTAYFELEYCKESLCTSVEHLLKQLFYMEYNQGNQTSNG